MTTESATSSAVEGNGHLPALQGSTERAADKTRVYTDEDFDFSSDPTYEDRIKPLAYDPTLLPNGCRSLSSIAFQAFALGLSLATCTFGTVYLTVEGYAMWRLSAFFSCLSLFHFLEFWTTARFNLPAARSSSFLLFNNGAAYNIAHTLAAIEVMVSSFFPWYQTRLVSSLSTGAGIALVVVGQTVRSVAMAQAGTNFNHTPAKTRKEGHTLVTRGVYSWFRHPSYFGFFWWAIGTQVMVGNKVCLVGYIMVLWDFFRKRIIAEERTLVDFFGKDYEAFQKRTGTGIPFVK